MFLLPMQETPGQFDVERFHVLVWNLAGLFGAQRMLCDIGIALTAKSGPRSTFDLALPFDFDLADYDDLSAQIQHHPLLLPGASDVKTEKGVVTSIAFQPDAEAQDQSVAPTTTFAVEKVEKVKTGRVSGRKRGVWSRVRVTLKNPIPQDTEGYARLRFHVHGRTGLVFWKRSLMAINGAVYEIRTGSGPGVTDGSVLQEIAQGRVKPRRTSITIVARSRFQPSWLDAEIEPALLDSGEWPPYLDRATDLRRESALTAYSIRESDDDDDIGPSLFLDVSREFGLLSLGNFLRIAITVAFVFVLFRSVGWFGSSDGVALNDVTDSVSGASALFTERVRWLWAMVVAGGFAAAWITARIVWKRFARVRKSFWTIRKKYWAAERKLFRARYLFQGFRSKMSG